MNAALGLWQKEHGGDPVAMRQFIYARYSVQRFSQLTWPQMSEVMDALSKPGPEDEEGL